MIIPAIANPLLGCVGLPRNCDRATKPKITAKSPGIGIEQANPKTMAMTPEINEAIDIGCGVALTFVRNGAGCATGGCHGPVIGARSSGGIQAPGFGRSCGSHCVDASEGSSKRVGRIRGSQFGSAGGVRSSRRSEPSFVQKVSQVSVYWLLHWGQYFIRVASDQFETTEEIRDFDGRVFV